MAAVAPCSVGYYCMGGLLAACPAGTFRDAASGARLQDCAQCPVGFFCRAFSVVTPHLFLDTALVSLTPPSLLIPVYCYYH